MFHEPVLDHWDQAQPISRLEVKPIVPGTVQQSAVKLKRTIIGGAGILILFEMVQL